jgi:hypothetical protein
MEVNNYMMYTITEVAKQLNTTESTLYKFYLTYRDYFKFFVAKIPQSKVIKCLSTTTGKRLQVNKFLRIIDIEGFINTYKELTNKFNYKESAKWTPSAKECYFRGSICEGCYYTKLFKINTI